MRGSLPSPENTAAAIPCPSQFGRGSGPGGIPLDHVVRKRRGLLPEFVERGDEFAIDGVVA